MLKSRLINFEEKIQEIDTILKSRRNRWDMESVPSVAWEDVEQIIRIHIFIKFEKWDQNKPFGPWCSQVINRQIINIKTKLIGRFISPCQRCPFNLGDSLCAKTKSGKKCEECPLFAKWEKKKKTGYNLVLARSTNETFEGEDDLIFQPEGGVIDLVEATNRLHDYMLGHLTGRLKKFYQLKYIDEIDDEVISFSFGFTTTEEGRIPGYRQLYNMENEIRILATDVLRNQDIF